MASVISSVLVGREQEAAALRAAYDRAGGRQPVTVLVSGEAGIGKSRLVDTVVQTLPGDPLVLSGGCLELGAEGTPYVPFAAIVRDLVRQLGRQAVAACLPPSGSALGDWLPELGPAPARYPRIRLLEEMLALVGKVSQVRPAVLIVEDLHWADASSRELFAYLARNLAGGAVLLIGTVRTGQHPTRQLLAELARGGDVVRLPLAPLQPRQVSDLLAAIDGRAPHPARAARIHRRSGGNPLFVEALSNAGESPADDLNTLLLDRITALPPAGREALEILAVAGAPVSDQSLGALGVQEAALHDLVGRDLVVAAPDGFAIRHDLIREAVYAALLPSRRRELHARFAATLPAGSTALAEHWLAAGATDRALPAAWQAADRARRQHAFDEQLHLLDLILARWDDRFVPACRTEVLEQAATAALAAGKPAIGVEHCTAALDSLDPAAEQQQAGRQQVARLLGLRGRLRYRLDGSGRDDLERAVALVPPGACDALRSSLLSALAFIEWVALRTEQSDAAAAEALRLADALDDEGLRAPALLVLAGPDRAAGRLEQARRTFDEARRSARAAGDDHTFLTTFQWEAVALETVGHYAEAAELAHAGQQAAERLGQTRARGSMLAVARAMPLRFLGRWQEALDVLDDALAGSPPPMYAAFMHLVAAEIARYRGESDRFEQLVGHVREFAMSAGGSAQAELAIQQLAWLHDQGQLEEADRLLGEHLRAEPPPSGQPPHEVLRLALLGARIQRARRASAPRNQRAAAAVAHRLAQLTRLVDGVATQSPVLTAYRLTFVAESGPGELAAWDRAAAAWRELGNPYETATVLTAAAGSALASNNRPGARVRLGQARTLAAELGAAPLLARIDELAVRGRLSPEPAAAAPNDFGLTPREVEVLRVLARGRSNPQIAAELFITPNTVATHVARILGKLGVATRTEAATKAHETGLLDPA